MNPANTTAEIPRKTPTSSAGSKDRWLIWPALAVLAGMFCFTFLCGLPGTLSFVLIPLFVLGEPVVGAVLAVWAAVQAIKKRPRKAVSFALAVMVPLLLKTPIDWAADCLHLGLMRGFGIGQIESASTQNGTRFEVYDWSVGLAGGPNTFLIHDTTDEIALPPALHKHPIESENGFGPDCAGNVKHLIGHYYICTF